MRLVKGAENVVPPSGEVNVIAASDGSISVVDDDGTSNAIPTGQIQTANIASGAVTAAKIADIAQDTWFNTTKAAMLAAIPQLTGFDYIRPSHAPNGSIVSTVAADPHIEGGGIGVASDTTWLRLTSETVFQDPKSGKWAIAFRGKFPSNTAGVTALFAAINSASTRYASFGIANGTSSTKFLIQVYNSGATNQAGTVNSDTSFHDFMLTCDGSTLTLYVDGVSAATLATTNMQANDPMQIAMFSVSAATPGLCVQKVAYGFVAP